MTLLIREATSRRDLRRFVGFAYEMYDARRYPNWVAPLRMAVRDALDDRGNPFYREAARALFLAVRDGDVVGRIAAIENRAHNRFHDDRVGFWGFFECVDDQSVADALFAAVPFTPTVVQWHWDAVVELPPGAVLLASSPRYPHQAFRVGELAWGLQFHIETPPEMVTRWFAEDDAGVRDAGLDPSSLLARTLAELDDVAACWRPVVERFAALALG